MRIRALSDLHIDVGGGPLPAQIPQEFEADCGEDVVVLAGDLAEGMLGLRWAVAAFPAKPLVIVLGNHEYYREEMSAYLAEYRSAVAEFGGRVRLLEKDAVVIEGVRFVGATLWTDYALYGGTPQQVARAMQTALAPMLDYRRILVAEEGAAPRYLKPADTVRFHSAARQYVTLALASGDPRRTVVVTHHAPHRGSLAARYAEDLTSAAFVSDLGMLMGRAALWIHGHTHTSFDYAVNGTRVVCNPRGYCSPDGSRRENPAFDWNRVVEI